LVILATGVVQSCFCAAINIFYRRRMAHLHAVHGGSHDERHSFGRKRHLLWCNVWFVAVSEYVRERLVYFGVPSEKIRVIENFIPDSALARFRQRGAYTEDGVTRILVLSRLDPLKRVDLLIDAFDRAPDLRHLQARIFGSGSELEKLQARSRERHPNIQFMGFSNSIPHELASADLLVHLCPREACPVTLLEAAASGIPVLVPDRGGTAAMVEDGVTGFLFAADDADDLARCLRVMAHLPAERLNAVAQAARQALEQRYSASGQIAKYRELITRACPVILQ
jgi:glycosyltransferase involved in cell wall biosynthesis